MNPVYIGACSFCDFQHQDTDPVACNMAIIRHECERKYPGLDPLAEDFIDQCRARGIPISDTELHQGGNTVSDAPASVTDPHRSLVRSVTAVFDNMTRTLDGY